MRFLRSLVSLLASCLPALVAVAATAATPASSGEQFTVAGERVVPLQYNGDVRFLPLVPSTEPRLRVYQPLRTINQRKTTPAGGAMAAMPAAPVASAPMPAATQNFAGLSFTDACSGGQCGTGWPPDTNGDVGKNHYILAVNGSYAIYNKTGTRLAAFTEDQLWNAVGSSPCNGNSQGDPIVLYDALADRWILTHFAFGVSGGVPVAPFYQCFAVSKTSDPVAGGWWFYALRMDPGTPGTPPVGNLNDYSKFGIWNDCLYMAANEFAFPSQNFSGVLFASLSRADMYAGAPLTWALGFFDVNVVDPIPFTMLPSNASGRAASSIPAGTPNYFVSESTVDYAFEVRKFTPGTNCGAGGSMSAAVVVPQASYDFNLPNASQPNTGNTLDTTGDRLMQKAQYRKVGSKESVWVVHTTQTPSGWLAPQWAQIDVTGGTIAPTAVQQQIFAPTSSLHRWMGSLAVDGQGNMALGYSTSGNSAPNFPSIAYAGRLAADPLNQLPQTEVQLVAGLGSQTNNCGGAPCDRWGDYTAMSVDPVDDCTFWYTNEYYSSQANGTAGNWQTRIGAFRFASCSVVPPSTTGLTSSANPSVAGVNVTFTATVTGTTPTGTVKFDDGGTTILGCGAVALGGTGNSRTAACTTAALSAGLHTINAAYSGDAGNAASTASVTQLVSQPVPGTATVVVNPYGPVTVQGATLVGNTISNFSNNTVIQLGSVPGTSSNFAEIDFQGLNLGPGAVLTIRSGAPGQFVFLVNTNANGSAIAGTLQAQGGNGAAPPALYVKNPNGLNVVSGGSILAPAGLGIATLGASWTTGNPIVNAGTLDGGTILELLGSRINGGGAFKGNSVTLRTFGNANNPVNGAFFLSNGLQLFPSTGNAVALTLNAYGSVPQFINVMVNGDASLWMPSAWPAGSTVPPNNAVLAPGATRPAGVPDPAYGGGSIILQATGAATLVNGGTNDFAFPGGIAIKAGGVLNLNAVLVNQGWTTSGKSFQGIFFESPTIVSPAGNIPLYSNNLNWMNFSTFPQANVRAFVLARNPDGSASFQTADTTAPHLNTYSLEVNTAASGGCWTCVVNTNPVNMYGP